MQFLEMYDSQCLGIGMVTWRLMGIVEKYTQYGILGTL